MKKFFALALAVAMIMSMAAVSFATNVFEVVGPFDYDADKNIVRDTGIQYGDTVLFQILEGGAIEDYSLVEKLKVKVTYEMGEELVESLEVVKKKVDVYDAATDFVAPVENDYCYFLAMKVAKKATTADADIVGTFELSRKVVKEDSVVIGEKAEDEEFDFAVNVFYDANWNASVDSIYMVDGSEEVPLKWDTDYVLKFNCDEDAEFTFGYDALNEGTFTVDVSGQGKLYVRYNTTADDAIVAANPGVKMHFVNFNNVKFNRTGEFAYEMEDGVACYKVVDGALVEIPGAEYDAADETFYFNTRVLESYVFADAELVNPVVEAPVVEAPAVTNPTTGA